MLINEIETSQETTKCSKEMSSVDVCTFTDFSIDYKLNMIKLFQGHVSVG